MPLTDDLKDTLTFILAGGVGSRLKPLTGCRAKPAVPFGGAYRIIDFTLSNCIHSGLRRIHVLTQYQARSLEEHIRFGWNFLPRRLEQFIGVRPPHHNRDEKWYLGTADAIYHNLDSIQEENPKHVVILSGDHIYKMDYGRMLREHVQNEAALTIGAVKIPLEESDRFGVFEAGTDGRVVAFQEKPKDGAQIPGQPGWCYGSMGIYIFETDELVRRLREDAEMGTESNHDFGKDIIPRMVEESRVFAHAFIDQDGQDPPYWRDVGTLDAYFESNLDLCSVEPKFNLYDIKWPTYTRWHNDPPAKTVLSGGDGPKVDVVDSLLCPGVVVSGAHLRRSILANRVHVKEGAEIEECILFSGVVVGKNVRLRRVIVDKWVEIPDGVTIGYDEAEDRARFTVTDSGVTVVPKGYCF